VLKRSGVSEAGPGDATCVSSADYNTVSSPWLGSFLKGFLTVRFARVSTQVLAMDSPHFQSSSQPQRIRANSTLSVHSIDHRGAIRKRSFDHPRSISSTSVDRLQQLALGRSDQFDISSLHSASNTHWITPQHSPQNRAVFPDSSVEPFPAWSVPTPPRSDSGLPTVSVDASEEAATTGVSSSQHFDFDQTTTSVDMR
jgi:hypothetical protein